jgi:peptidylprolyl isomerase
VTRWFTTGLISVFAILVIACGSASPPVPEVTTMPQATPTPQTTPTPPDDAKEGGAEQGDTVTVHYTGRLTDGTVFDSSEGKDPLEFTIGEGQIIPGFEQGVLGMEPGQSKTVNIPAEDAYGPYNSELVTEVERSQFPPDLKLEVGMQVQGSQPDGRVAVFTVKELTPTTVTLDANHRLAGKNLIFDIEMVRVN